MSTPSQKLLVASRTVRGIREEALQDLPAGAVETLGQAGDPARVEMLLEERPHALERSVAGEEHQRVAVQAAGDASR